jgi:hypothetical protein
MIMRWRRRGGLPHLKKEDYRATVKLQWSLKMVRKIGGGPLFLEELGA